MATSSPRTITSTIANPASKASPLSKFSSPRPQLRGARAEQELGLKKIIGTTTTSSNAFDALPEARSIGYLAGAVAVVAKIENDGTLSQRFYKAKQAIPTSGGYGMPLGELSLNPLSPTQGLRTRIPARNRDSPTSPSSFGSSSGFGSLDSPGSKNGSSIVEKVKPLTCLAFSPDGKFLAVGEAGHKPRVLVFSLASGGYTEPLWTTLSEHTFAVRCLAYSPDSELLATLGDINDGFLYIWSINAKNGAYTLRASNKCTTNVNAMAWVGNDLITVGTRHIKVWNVEATFAQDSLSRSLADQMSTLSVDSPRTLLGRNCLLGDLLDKTFTSVVSITADKAIVCSEGGDICLFEDNASSSHITWVGDTGFHVHTATLLSPNLLLIAGQGGNLRLLGLDKLIAAPVTAEMKLYEKGVKIKVGQTANAIVAMGYLGESLVILDSQKQIQILSCNPDASKLTDGSQNAIRCLPAHGTPPVGMYAIRQSSAGTASISWTADGSVLFWDYNGCFQKRVEVVVEQSLSTNEDLVNELKVVRMTKDSAYLVSGDRFGILRVTKIETDESVAECKAHTGDITDLVLRETESEIKIITAGRDRMIQIFDLRGEGLLLLQTLNDHVGAVTSLLLAERGNRLVSCSADRNVIVRDFVTKEVSDRIISGFIKTRSIVLKTTPLSMVINGQKTSHLLVSTADKQVLEYDLQTGNVASAFRAADSEGSSAAILNTICQYSHGAEQSLVAGISSTDKSVRIYDNIGSLLGRDHGQTESIAAMCIITAPQDVGGYALVTAASDGTVFLWQPEIGQERIIESEVAVKEEAPLIVQAPARRILTSSELAQLQDLRPPSEGTSSRPGSPKRNPSKLSQVQTSRSSADLTSTTPRRMSAAPPPLTMPTSETPRSRAGTATMRSPVTPRAQSPMSPIKARLSTMDRRRKSLSTGTPVGEPNVLLLATEQLCRSLQFYRKKLAAGADDIVPAARIRELEGELDATMRALADRVGASKASMMQNRMSDGTASTPNAQGIDEDRLLQLLESRMEARLLEKMSQKHSIPNGGDATADYTPATSPAPSTDDDSISTRESFPSFSGA